MPSYCVSGQQGCDSGVGEGLTMDAPAECGPRGMQRYGKEGDGRGEESEMFGMALPTGEDTV